MDPRTRVLLEAPIVPTLLRLGMPNVLIMLAQAAVGLVELTSSASLALMRLPASRWFFRS